jgi:purine-binding chemotaxis protein CheW
MTVTPPTVSHALVVIAGARAYAIDLRDVRETMRPLPVEPVAGTPPVVLGVAVIRGGATPVVELRRLFQADAGDQVATRFVTLAVSEGPIALAVDRVVGVRPIDRARMEALPPLLGDAAAGVVSAIDTTDARLLMVLRAARLLPEDVWATLATAEDR